MSQDSKTGKTLTRSPSLSRKSNPTESPLTSTRSISVWGTPRSSTSALIVHPGAKTAEKAVFPPVFRKEIVQLLVESIVTEGTPTGYTIPGGGRKRID